MHIIYIHQYFITPKRPGGTRSYEFSRYLLRKGHEVTMITSGLMNPEFPVNNGSDKAFYNVDGINLYSIRAGYNDACAGTKFSGWKRMIAFHQFSRLAARVGKTITEPSVVFATHTPLTVGLTGIHLKKHFNIPFLFEVRDLWPEALQNIGVLKNPIVVAYLKKMAKKIYKAADHISAASPGMKDGVLAYGIPNNKVTVVTNASDINLFDPDLDGADERKRLGIKKEVAAIYFGAMGEANGLDYVLDAALQLKKRGRSDIKLILHGSGLYKSRLKKRVIDEDLTNVIFSDPVAEKKQMAKIVAGCEICLTIYRAGKETSWSPNKLFDGLAAGKPILVNVPGWLGCIVEQNECGIQTEPNDAGSLSQALETLADNRLLRKKYGKNARRLAENEFSRDRQAGKLESIFLRLTTGN
jgi:glycosyltransferase involved in cell wall biosynthesis